MPVVDDVLQQVASAPLGTTSKKRTASAWQSRLWRKGGALVDAPGRSLVGAKREYPLRASYLPVASRDPGTIASVEPPPPPAARKWSWPDLMRRTFGVDAL